MTPRLLIGEKVVDLLNPQPEQIDLTAIERALWTAHRFSNNPKALKVRQHTGLVKDLAVILKAPPRVVQWCEHHDDHEGVIGDVPGPLKSYIEHGHAPHGAFNGDLLTLSQIETKLDWAIACARGIEPPDDDLRGLVHFYDKMAETLEWLFVLKRDPEPWNRPWSEYLTHNEAMTFVTKATISRAPLGLLD